MPNPLSQRYNKMFNQLANKNEGAFVPFVTLGDPDLTTSFKIIETLIQNGADALELAIPFSDPLADGPTIQASSLRALNSKTTPPACFSLLKKVREQYPNIPIGLLMYANLVFANGIDLFYEQCANAGIDSVLIADVPIRESASFCLAAKHQGIHSIFIAPPDADEATLKLISEQGSGYTYLLSRAGVTGAENKAGMPIAPLLDKLTYFNAAPSLLGFGISTPSQVKEAILSGASGAICGSAIVKIIEQNLKDEAAMLIDLGRFVHNMKNATKRK